MASIDLREPRLDVYASIGYPVGIHVQIDGGDVPSPDDVVARVLSPSGQTVATFTPSAAADGIDLSLTAAETLLIGTVTSRWFMVVDDRPWLGGVFDLSSPGVDPGGYQRDVSLSLVDWTVTVGPFVGGNATVEVREFEPWPPATEIPGVLYARTTG